MEINFKKVHTVKDLAISTIVLLAGIGFFFVNKGLGIIVAVCGFSMFFLYKGGYKKDGQGIVLQKKSEDLCKACKASVWMSITTPMMGLPMPNCSTSGAMPTSRRLMSSSFIPQKQTN